MSANLSNVSHAGLALAMQGVVTIATYLVGFSPVLGAALGGVLAIGFYWGREVAQAERKAGGKPWWIGFDMTLWSNDAILDFVFPVLASSFFFVVTFALTR